MNLRKCCTVVKFVNVRLLAGGLVVALMAGVMASQSFAQLGGCSGGSCGHDHSQNSIEYLPYGQRGMQAFQQMQRSPEFAAAYRGNDGSAGGYGPSSNAAYRRNEFNRSGYRAGYQGEEFSPEFRGQRDFDSRQNGNPYANAYAGDSAPHSHSHGSCQGGGCSHDHAGSDSQGYGYDPRGYAPQRRGPAESYGQPRSPADQPPQLGYSRPSRDMPPQNYRSRQTPPMSQGLAQRSQPNSSAYGMTSDEVYFQAGPPPTGGYSSSGMDDHAGHDHAGHSH